MRAVAVVKPDQIELVNIREPVLGPYDVLLRSEVGYICNATDRKVVEGHFPGVDQYPLILGHETVGIVEKQGEKVRHLHLGDRVVNGLLWKSPDPNYGTGWGGFSEFVVATDHQAMVEDGVADAEHGWDEYYQIQKVVPPHIPVEAAGMLATWREVYAGFSDFHLKPGDNIVVYGAGPVGLSFVKFGKLLGLNFIASVDPGAEKREKAIQMGADAAFPPGDPEIQGLSKHLGRPFDAVIDAVGKVEIMNEALPMIKMAGSVCVYGVIDSPTLLLEKLCGPYNFNLLVHQWPTRVYEAAAQEPLCEWIDQGKLSADEFLSAEFPIEHITEAYELTKTGKPIKTLIRF